LVYGYTAFTDFYRRDPDSGEVSLLTPQQKRDAVRTDEWQLRLHLINAIFSADFSSGTGVAIVVPMVRAGSTRVDDWASDGPTDSEGNILQETNDDGFGDLEMRIRQNILTPLGISGGYIPRITLSVGAVAPTGHFIIKSTGGSQTDSSRYVSVGRGLWWGLADVDVFGRIIDRLGYIVQFASRTPFGTLENDDGYGFAWGPEMRVNAGFTGVIVKGLLNGSITGEYQYRARGEERFTADDDWAPFANGGAATGTVTATLQVVLPAGLNVSVNGRMPFYYDVYGTQPVPGMGIFGALSWSWAADPPPPRTSVAQGEKPGTKLISDLIVPGKVTVIDYWATWCGPCKKLAPILEKYGHDNEHVVVKKVDATDWGVAEMKKYLPAVAGLPVVDIYGYDGRLIERLVGPECFKYESRIPAKQ